MFTSVKFYMMARMIERGLKRLYGEDVVITKRVENRTLIFNVGLREGLEEENPARAAYVNKGIYELGEMIRTAEEEAQAEEEAKSKAKSKN